MYSRDELEVMRGEGVLGDFSPIRVGSVWGKIKKGAKAVGKGALKYNPVSLQIRAAKAMGKWSAKKMAAIAKGITSAIAYPLKRAIRPIVKRTAVAVAKRKKHAAPDKSDRREANKIVITGLKKSKNPLFKFAGYTFAYVGTGVSGISGEEHVAGQRTWRTIRNDVGAIYAVDVAAVAASASAILLATPLLIKAFTRKAAEGSSEEKPPEEAAAPTEASESAPAEEPAPEEEESVEGDTLFHGPY